MTATTFSRPAIAAAGVVAASLGRAGQWTLAQYMRAPLASTGLLALVTLTALAASNALYFQTTRHPAPFFAPAMDVPMPVTAPQAAPEPMPALTREVIPAPAPTAETTGSVASPPAVASDAPVGNPDAFAVQKKLTELGLFNGKVDGFYGPMTANAIRLFETRNGMTPTGALSRQVIDAILRADSAGRAPAQPQAAVVQPQPQPVVQPQPVQQAVVAPAPQPQQDQVIARLPDLSPVDQAVDTIGTAAAQTLDSIVAAVDGGRSAPANPIPALPLMASTAQPMPMQLAAVDPAPAQPTPAPAASAAADVAPANNVQLVSSIQSGLASLGFYHGPIDGHPGDATARAIREFENFHSYRVTGQVKPDLVGLLRQAGAEI